MPEPETPVEDLELLLEPGSPDQPKPLPMGREDYLKPEARQGDALALYIGFVSTILPSSAGGSSHIFYQTSAFVCPSYYLQYSLLIGGRPS
jgi:hypothetical protein